MDGQADFFPAPGTGYYFPLAYLPQALGLLIGRTLGLSVDTSYRLARLGVLAATAANFSVAFSLVRMSPFVLVLLVLPMTVFQRSSASLDAFTTGLSVLATSLFIIGAQREQRFRMWMRVVLPVSVLAVSTCRPNMVPLLLFPTIVAYIRRERTDIVLSVLAWCLTLIWFAVATMSTREPLGEGHSTTGAIYFYLHHPMQLSQVVLATIEDKRYADLLVREFVGILGWVDAPLPPWFYFFAGVTVLVVFALSISLRVSTCNCLVRPTLLVVAVLSTLLIFFLLLVTFNAMPAPVVSGLQGRYFLIPLIILGYFLSPEGNTGKRKSHIIGLCLTSIFAILSFYAVADVLLDRYYVTDLPLVKYELRRAAP